jgi:ATP-dependent helicase HrpB
MRDLPIDASLPEIIAGLRGGSLVIVAPPGSGKTTRVPPALAESDLIPDKNGAVVVLQPRRVAARAAAARVADERGWTVGTEVGYQVRFERRLTACTRIRYLTEGVLTRQLLDDPFLEGVSAVVIDEFHERNVEGDLALALLREIQREVRPDLLIVVMSATLDAEPISHFLGDCPIVKVDGGLYPVAIEYRPSPRPTSPEAVLPVVAQVLADRQNTGDILVFLPGAGEIRRVARALEGSARQAGADVLPLYGSLPAEEQDRAIRPSKERKVILSTNIAETSLTIDGVTTIIDSGLARSVHYDDARGIDRWQLARISRASSVQRAGRAGRTAPGRCIRLWSEREQRGLEEFERPEIERIDLSGTVLSLHAWGQKTPDDFAWYQSPSRERVASAERLLRMLGAVDPGSAQITPLGRRLLELPLHPRLGRLLVAASDDGYARLGATIAALLSERDLLQTSGDTRTRTAPARRRTASDESDLFVRLESLREAELNRFHFSTADRGIDVRAAREVCRLRDELLRRFRSRDRHERDATSEPEPHYAILKWLLLAYPDRVVKRRGVEGTGRMVGGRGVCLSASSVVHDAELFVAVVARETERSPQREVLVTVASAIEAEWLESLFAHELRRERVTEFDPKTERVVTTNRLWYHDLPLREDTRPATDRAEAGAVLAQALRSRGPEIIRANPDAALFLAKLELLRRWAPEVEWPEIHDEFLAGLLDDACQGRVASSELNNLPWGQILNSWLAPLQKKEMRESTPDQLSLPSGRMSQIQYEHGRPPMISARVQDLLGWNDTPRIVRGRAPLLLEILGPNQRPVQITDDLRSFWTNTYAQVRKDLRGRYPKHAWPEDALNSPPVPPRKRN